MKKILVWSCDVRRTSLKLTVGWSDAGEVIMIPTIFYDIGTVSHGLNTVLPFF